MDPTVPELMIVHLSVVNVVFSHLDVGMSKPVLYGVWFEMSGLDLGFDQP